MLKGSFSPKLLGLSLPNVMPGWSETAKEVRGFCVEVAVDNDQGPLEDGGQRLRYLGFTYPGLANQKNGLIESVVSKNFRIFTLVILSRVSQFHAKNVPERVKNEHSQPDSIFSPDNSTERVDPRLTKMSDHLNLFVRHGSAFFIFD